MTKEPSNIDFFVILKEFTKKWYLFALSILITLSIALFYIKFAAKTYNIEATILIKTNKENTASDPSDVLQGIEFINQEKNFKNEIQILQSIPMIREVVKDLNLRISYFIQEDKVPKEFLFSLKDIYNTAPFMVIIDESHIQPLDVYFYIRVINDDEFIITSNEKDIWLHHYSDETENYQISEFSLNGKFHFGDQIQNDFCSFRVLLNSNYNPAVYRGKDLYFLFNSYNTLAENFQTSLLIEQSWYDATIAKLKFVGDNPAKSIDFLNSLINKYIQKNLNDKNHLAISTIEYIDRQLSSISDSLVYTERQLQNFRRSYNVLNIDEKAQQIYSQLQTLETQRDDIFRNLTYLQELDRYFKIYRDSSNIIIPSSIGINDPTLNSLIQELTTLYSEKERMIINDQVRNPRFQTINASIENLKNVIIENTKFSINTINNSLKDINKRISELNFEFSQLPQTQRQLLGIERKFKLTDAVYTSLLEKRVQAQIARASNVADCEIIEPARYMSVASPNKILNLLIAIFIGFIIPATYVIIKRLSTDLINDTNELKKYCNLKQIGSIPYHKISAENVIKNHPLEPISESIRSIRSNMDYFLLGQKNKIILVTSSLPQEGKSFVTLNLATSFAVAQHKTLLLGFDLRKKNYLAEEFKIKNLVGLSSYLIGKASLEDIIITTDTPNLDIIIPGDVPPNPVELLTSPSARDLFTRIKEMYDYVFIDSPPFGLVTDAFILMRHADLSIYIARLSTITTRALSGRMEEIESKEML